jgi:hypothetical protein
LLQTFEVELEFSSLNFTKHSAQGSLSVVDPWYEGYYITTNAELHIEDEWVVLRGKKILWLPSKYRPSRSAFKYDIFVGGRTDGRVLFMGFRL